MQKAQGFVENGNLVITVGGVSAAQKAQGSYPQATVNVYNAGTLVLATIYSDNSLTPKANPFTASVTGYFFFYGANGRYDVTFSGGGLAAPLTFGDVLLADPFASGGAVTSFKGRTGAVVPADGDYTLTQIADWPDATAPIQYLRSAPTSLSTYEFHYPPAWMADDFVFAAQTPGGSLSIGANVITLTPVPLGINGANTSHYVYISGGTGTAEAVLITGGTAVAGAASGTLIFTCANTHSGAWTIQTATAGIQEMLYHAVSFGTTGIRPMVWPSVDSFLYACTTFPVKPWGPSFNISGPGKIAPSLVRGSTYPAGDLFLFQQSGGNIGALYLSGANIFSTGVFGSPINTSGAAIHVKGNTSGEITIENLQINMGWRGIEIESCGSATVRNVKLLNPGFFAAALPSETAIYIHDATGIKLPSDIIIDGVLIHGGAGPAEPNTTQAGIRIDASDGIHISNSYIIQLKNAIIINGYTARGIGVTSISGCILDSFREHVILIQGNLAPFIGDISVSDCWVSARADLFPGVASLENILLDASVTASRIRFTNNWIVGSKLAGIRSTGVITDLIVANNHITDNNYSNTASEPGIALAVNTTGYTITDNQIYNTPTNPNSHQKYGISISGSDNGVVSGNTLSSNETAPFLLAGTITGLVLTGNQGVDDVSTTNVASGATVTFPGYPFFTLTGNTAVGAVDGALWEGATGTFVASHAGPGAWTAGATIGNTFTPTQNRPVLWTYRNGKIYLQ